MFFKVKHILQQQFCGKTGNQLYQFFSHLIGDPGNSELCSAADYLLKQRWNKGIQASHEEDIFLIFFLTNQEKNTLEEDTELTWSPHRSDEYAKCSESF